MNQIDESNTIFRTRMKEVVLMSGSHQKENKPFKVTNRPYYQGNSEIPLAVGVGLKTSKEEKQNNPPLQHRIKQAVCAGFFPARMAH